METAVPGRSSKLPAISMILPNDHRLLQKQQHILLTQMTFGTFINPKQKEQECEQNKRMTASLTDTSVKNAWTPTTTEGLEQKSEELSLKK
jgi:hypothetical protein